MTEKDVSSLYAILLDVSENIGELKGKLSDLPFIKEQVNKIDVMQADIKSVKEEQKIMNIVLKGNGEPDKGLCARVTAIENKAAGIKIKIIEGILKWVVSKTGVKWIVGILSALGVGGGAWWFLH